MCDKTTKIRKAVEEYSAMRTIQLLQENHFSFRDLSVIIASEVTLGVVAGISSQTQPMMASGEISLDKHMRMFLPPE